MRTLLPFSLLLSSLLLSTVACTSSTTAEPDAEISFTAPDATPEDTGSPEGDGGTSTPDGAVMSTDIGQSCSSDTDCSEFCATEREGFRDGYCTAFCNEDVACPDGSVCLQVSRSQALCFAECDSTAEERQCRAGYGCAVDISLPAPVCIPGCTDDTDCDEGRVCNPERGGSCYDPEAEWGDGCGGSSDCPDGAFCFAERWRGWPGGMCMAFGCDESDASGGCPSGTVCIPGRHAGYGRCVAACETAEDCRDGYTCEAHADYPERLSCHPACETNSQCSDGRVCTDEGTCG